MHSKEVATVILRVSLALVFLYFGIQQTLDPGTWSGFVPEFLQLSIVSANNIVILNGLIEIILGTFLIVGLYVRFASMVMSLHLFGIAFSIGLSPLGVRDFGLAFATLALFFFGADRYTVDYRFGKKETSI
ncbi:MAG: DoxX family protein [Nanoarchaeota archaeon]|mgnify:CR=1 FL=1